MTNIHAAYVSAFAELSNPTKDRTANAGHYSYRYADLATILDHVRPVLAKHELALSQNVTTADDGRLEVWTYLHHSSGDVITFGPLSGRASASWQDTGSAITYARRYALGAALGIAPEDDDDAATAPAPVKVTASPKVTRSKPTAPVEDAWTTPSDPFPVDPETGEAATLAEAVSTVVETIGGRAHDVGTARGPLARTRAETPITPEQLKLAKRLLDKLDDGVNIVADYFGEYRAPEEWTKYEASGDKGQRNGLIDRLIDAEKAAR